MAISLRKRIKLFAGVYLNISKTSIKGTGISYRTTIVKPEDKSHD